MRTKKIFIVCFAFWFADFFTTIIGLNLFNCEEKTLIPRILYSYGLPGYFIMLSIMIIVILLFSISISKGYAYTLNKSGEDKASIWLIPILVFCSLFFFFNVIPNIITLIGCIF
jgi:Mg2+/Co2+ transporter CorB